MTEHLYCGKCKTFPHPMLGTFPHPDLGVKQCLRCPYCGSMVYPKDDKLEVGA